LRCLDGLSYLEHWSCASFQRRSSPLPVVSTRSSSESGGAVEEEVKLAQIIENAFLEFIHNLAVGILEFLLSSSSKLVKQVPHFRAKAREKVVDGAEGGGLGPGLAGSGFDCLTGDKRVDIFGENPLNVLKLAQREAINGIFGLFSV
jgi:hypothetical protein